MTYALYLAGSRSELYQLRQAKDENNKVIRHSDDCAVYHFLRKHPLCQLEKLAKEGKEIFLIPNYIPVDVEGDNGTGANFVTECTVLFAEFDNGSVNEQWQKLEQFNALTGLDPSLILFSGGKSLHIYFSLSKPNTEKARWQTLQRKLIVCLESDPSIKTLNREMRAAGFYRASKGQYQSVWYYSNSAYYIDDIEAALDSTGKFPYGLSEARFNRWNNEGDRVLSIPEDELYPKLKPLKIPTSTPSFTGEIPLEELLSRAHKEALNGVSSNRNATGFALAKDLVGCANWLTANGYRYSGDPYLLFLDYCQRCASGGGWNHREWDSIWKSAQRGKSVA